MLAAARPGAGAPAQRLRAVARSPICPRSWPRSRRRELRRCWSTSGPPGASPAARRCPTWCVSTATTAREGLRLVMVSADDDDQRAEVARVLRRLGFDGAGVHQARQRHDVHRRAWTRSGAARCPATLLFDGAGDKETVLAGLGDVDELRARVVGSARQEETINLQETTMTRDRGSSRWSASMRRAGESTAGWRWARRSPRPSRRRR